MPVDVEFAQGAAAVPNIHLPAGEIVSNVVGVISIFDSLEKLEGNTVEDLHCAVLGTRYTQAVIARDIQHTLRLLKSRDGLRALARLEVDHFHGVVAKRGDKQPLAFPVNRHVVYAPQYFWQLDCL